MKLTKQTAVPGFFFVLILGTLSHFLYQWSGNNRLLGLVTPVSESTWEHMKLICFPSLLYMAFIWKRFEKTGTCASSAFMAGILAGTWMIPILFYTYSGILGKDVLILDLAVFALSDLTVFCTACHLSQSCRLQKYSTVLTVLLFIQCACFLLFTYAPPAIGLFADPLLPGN